MAPENSETTMAISKSIVLFLSLIVYTSPVCADEPSELYQLALSNAKSDQSASAPRLSDVLRWKDSLSDRLSPSPAKDEADSSRLAAFASSPLMKRVFCNGFTGCGGRFRGRRRMPSPAGLSRVISKRPFCNTYGCYNSGRKRSIQAPPENNPEPSQDTDQKMITVADEWPWIRIKKLFCNGYGGCQNMGKRLQITPGSSDSKLSTSGHSLSLPFSKDSLDSDDGKKRFFTSGFDEDMDSLINSMKR